MLKPSSRAFNPQYDADGKNTLGFFPNGEQEQRAYTTRGRLSSLTVGPPGAAVDSFSYLYTDPLGHYDPTGHLQQEVDAGSRAHVFSYGNLYQLKQETHPDFGTIGYGYDLNGNRTSKTTSGGTDYYGVDAANKLLWVNRGTNAPPTSGQVNPYTLFGYDLNGNVTSRERRDDSGLLQSFGLSWDGDNRLRSVNEGVTNRFTATYDGGGTRISKTDSWTGSHSYSGGPGGLVYDSAGPTTYTPGLSQQAGGVDRYPLHDWLGSTRYLTDSSQVVKSALRFDAYGNRSLTGGTDAYDPSDFQFGAGWGYQSEYASSTEPGLGLQLLGERYYDPAVGRSISQDPVGLSGAETSGG